MATLYLEWIDPLKREDVDVASVNARIDVLICRGALASAVYQRRQMKMKGIACGRRRNSSSLTFCRRNRPEFCTIGMNNGPPHFSSERHS